MSRAMAMAEAKIPLSTSSAGSALKTEAITHSPAGLTSRLGTVLGRDVSGEVLRIVQGEAQTAPESTGGETAGLVNFRERFRSHGKHQVAGEAAGQRKAEASAAVGLPVVSGHAGKGAAGRVDGEHPVPVTRKIDQGRAAEGKNAGGRIPVPVLVVGCLDAANEWIVQAEAMTIAEQGLRLGNDSVVMPAGPADGQPVISGKVASNHAGEFSGTLAKALVDVEGKVRGPGRIPTRGQQHAFGGGRGGVVEAIKITADTQLMAGFTGKGLEAEASALIIAVKSEGLAKIRARFRIFFQGGENAATAHKYVGLSRRQRLSAVKNLQGFGVLAVPVQHVGQSHQHVNVVGFLREHKAVFSLRFGVAIPPGQQPGIPAVSLQVRGTIYDACFGEGKGLIHIAGFERSPDLRRPVRIGLGGKRGHDHEHRQQQACQQTGSKFCMATSLNPRGPSWLSANSHGAHEETRVAFAP